MILLDKDEAWPMELNPDYDYWLQDSKYGKKPTRLKFKPITKFMYEMAVKESKSKSDIDIKTKLRIHPDYASRLSDKDCDGLLDGSRFAGLEIEFTKDVGLEIV